MLAKLTEFEAEVFQSIVNGYKNIDRRHLYDRSFHVKNAGAFNMNEEQISAGRALHRKGWLETPPEYLADFSITLTVEAWNLVSLDEWELIEEEARKSAAGNDYGSW